MNCPETAVLLDRQAVGDLAPEAASALSKHLAECPTCARTADRHAQEDLLFRELAADLHDRKPLWPAVQAAIRSREREREKVPIHDGTLTWGRFAWIGAPLLAAVVLAVLPLLRSHNPPERVPDPTAEVQRVTAHAEDRYRQAIGILRREVFSSGRELPEATVDALTRGLADLDRTIAAAQQVWRNAPDDPLASRYLLTAYARKLELLMRHTAAS